VTPSIDQGQLLDDVRSALWAARAVTLAQAFALVRAAAATHGWAHEARAHARRDVVVE